MVLGKMGRPTDNPKTEILQVRLSEEDKNKLEYCSQLLNKPKAEIMRLGIEKVYQELKK